MSNQEKENSSPEDKCSNCGNTDPGTFWDYDDCSVLCEKCYEKMGDEWNERIHAETENEDEILVKTKHKKSKSDFTSGRNTNMKKYVIGGAVFILALILIFSARTIIAGGSNSG